jgi:hypothetical protein
MPLLSGLGHFVSFEKLFSPIAVKGLFKNIYPKKPSYLKVSRNNSKFIIQNS